jgi:hypothetical protein
MAWLQEDQQRLQRYVHGDARLPTEFATEYRSGFIDPIRRTAGAPDAATALRNRQLPSAPRGSGIVPPNPGDLRPKTEDEVHDNAWQQFKQLRQAGAGG